MPQKDSRTQKEWESFCKLPFDSVGGYFKYVLELATITTDYSKDMGRKNSSGDTIFKIIKNGASRVHFEGLMNGSRLLMRLGTKGTRLGIGTTRNEQLHRELKSWMRNIYQIHEDRLLTGLNIFLFCKLITHSSAAYSPTLTQNSQQRLLYIIAGKLRISNFFLLPSDITTHKLSIKLSNNQLQRAFVSEDATFSTAKRFERERCNRKWKKLDKKKLRMVILQMFLKDVGNINLHIKEYFLLKICLTSYNTL